MAREGKWTVTRSRPTCREVAPEGAEVSPRPAHTPRERRLLGVGRRERSEIRMARWTMLDARLTEWEKWTDGKTAVSKCQDERVSGTGPWS